jgi:two-component system, NarL family, sensor histidine kinase DegS
MQDFQDGTTTPGPLEAMIAGLRTELAATQDQRKEIGVLVKQSAAELERLAPRVKESGSRAQRAQAAPDSFSRAELREVYEASQEAQLRQFMMQSQLEQLTYRDGHLQRTEELLARLLGEAGSLVDGAGVRDAAGRAQAPGGPALAAPASGDSMEAALASLEAAHGRVSRHLQEDTAQALSDMMLRAEVCERLVEVDQGRAREELGQLRLASSGALKSIRRLVHELRPPALDEAGLPAALRRFVEASGFRERAEVELRVDGAERRLPGHVELGLFRVLQEALLNAAAHSGAGRIELALSFRPAELAATVSDGGSGFDAAVALLEGGQMRLTGLAAMQRWARLIGGTLSIASEPGAGTTVSVTVPA